LKDATLPSTLGLIAGEGRFPFMVLEEAKRLEIDVVTLAIEGEADPALETAAAPEFHRVGLGQLSRCVRIFHDRGVSQAVMAGRVRHVKAFQILRPDPLMLKVLSRVRSKSTDAILKTLADVMGDAGVELVDSTALVRVHLATEGAMGKRKPSRRERDDMGFGIRIARGLAELDIGQTVVIKEKAVVSVEAMEGSDAAIRRARDIVEGPFVVVKVARPAQDPRFDVPVVGPGTIDSMVTAGATVLGLEVGRVLLVERERLLERADANRIAVFGVANG